MPSSTSSPRVHQNCSTLPDLLSPSFPSPLHQIIEVNLIVWVGYFTDRNAGNAIKELQASACPPACSCACSRSLKIPRHRCSSRCRCLCRCQAVLLSGLCRSQVGSTRAVRIAQNQMSSSPRP
jgi:hypothetical protein